MLRSSAESLLNTSSVWNGKFKSFIFFLVLDVVNIYLIGPFQDDAFNVVFQQRVHLDQSECINEIIVHLFGSHLFAITLTNSLFLVNNLSRALSSAFYGQCLHAKGHLGEGKKGTALDVTPDLVDCRRQLVHLGERLVRRLQQVSASFTCFLMSYETHWGNFIMLFSLRNMGTITFLEIFTLNFSYESYQPPPPSRKSDPKRWGRCPQKPGTRRGQSSEVEVNVFLMRLGRNEYLIIRDGGLFFFDKVDSLVPEGTWPVRVNVEVAGNVGRDHH